MKRKLLALLLAAALLIGAAPAALAAASADDMLEVLAALGVMNGDENGNLNLDQSVTRAQFTKMAVAASGGSAESGGSGFADVPDSHWASGYVAAASEAKLLNGYPDGSFRPDGTVTMAEAASRLRLPAARGEEGRFGYKTRSPRRTFCACQNHVFGKAHPICRIPAASAERVNLRHLLKACP